MAEDEYVYEEPTNEQLANFLMVYAKQIPELDGMRLSAPVLESLMSQNKRFRDGALRKHKMVQEAILKHDRMMQAGKLQCEHILESGKRCPNQNKPGHAWCGLHYEEHEVEVN